MSPNLENLENLENYDSVLFEYETEEKDEDGNNDFCGIGVY